MKDSTKLINTYLNCAKSASQGLIKNWLLLLGSVAAVLAMGFASSLLYPLGFAGGLILGLFHIYLLSVYYGWLFDTVENSKIQFKHMFTLNPQLFSTVLSAAFILYVVSFLLGITLETSFPDSLATTIGSAFGLLVFLVFNCIPEVIYINRHDGVSAFFEAATFTRDFWIEWYLPLVIALLPSILQSSDGALAAMAGADPLLPTTLLYQAIVYWLQSMSWISTILAIVLANWFMLFRGFLYKDISNGSLRRTWPKQ